MKKKTYINPVLYVVELAHEMPIAQSNGVASDGGSVNLNPNTMLGGDGDDAVKESNSWDIWGD